MIVFLSVRFYRNNIQKEFLAEKDLTFAKAFETAQPMEMPSREDFNEVRIPPEVSINKINRFSSPRCPGQGSGICCAQNITHRNAGVKKKLIVIDARKRALSPISVPRIVNLTPRGMLRMSHSQMPLKAQWISVCTFSREKGKAGVDIKLSCYWRVRKSVWK